MAHSHQRHRHSGHKRAAQFLSENSRGGACAPKKRHGGSVSGKPARGNDSETDLQAEGHAPKRRRGGKIAKPMHVAIVNIHAHHPPLGMQDAAGAMVPQGAPMGGPPVGPGMSGAGAPVLPGAMPGRPAPFKRGGHVYGDVPEDVANYKPARPHKARGGRTHHVLAGAASGIGRLQQFEDQKKRER
jgi:hypothetical protein